MMEQFERMDKEQQEEMGRYKRPPIFLATLVALHLTPVSK